MDLMYNNDLVITGGDISTVSGNNEVGQQVSDRLKTFMGEWFLDLSYGPNYRGSILVKNPNIPIISSILKKEIIKTEPDAKFTSFTSNLSSDRKLTINYEFFTKTGTISGSVTP